MLANGRAERLISPGNLWRRIFYQPLGRFQPSRAIPIPVALPRLRTVLVELSSKRVAGLAFKRLLHDQAGREFDQLVLRRSAGKTPLDQCRQLFTGVLRSRSSRRHGVLLCQAAPSTSG